MITTSKKIRRTYLNPSFLFFNFSDLVKEVNIMLTKFWLTLLITILKFLFCKSVYRQISDLNLKYSRPILPRKSTLNLGVDYVAA